MALPFSRYNPITHPNAPGAFKIPAGSRLRYIKNQGYTTAPVRAKRTTAFGAGVAADPYGSAIKNEGIFSADAADINAANTAARAQRDAAVKAAMFQHNDPANPFSTMAGIGRQNREAVGQNMAERAARGVLSSGGTRLQQSEIGYQTGLAGYNASNQVNSLIGQQDAALAETQRQNHQRLVAAVGEAAARLIENGIAPTTAGGIQRPPVTGGPDAAGIASGGAGFVSPEARRQAALNAQGYQTMFLGTPDETIRKMPQTRPDGSINPYTWEMHLQDLVKAGKAKTIPGFDYQGLPLPGKKAAALRRKGGYA